MAVDRQRLAEALAYGEQKRRMMESVPTVGNLPPAQPARRSLRTDLENFSAGLGQAGINALEGTKALITDPVGTAKGAYEGVKGIVRDPKVLAQALAETGRKAMSGPLGAGEVVGEMLGPMRGKPPMAEIDVYHGSPHRFEEFDASKIGTGEGAQAFGHGIYLAENPDVARGYKTGNELTQTVVEGKVIDFSDPRYQAAVRISKDGYQNALKKAIEESKSDFLTPEGKQKRMLLAEQIKALKGKKIGAETTGAFYTADLPDEMVDRMLDWDKPLKEQSAEIKKIAAMMGVDPDDPEIRGSGLQMKLTRRERKKAEEDIEANPDLTAKMPDYEAIVSEQLRQAGIPGIKYRDAGSRGQGGSGTRNFVVFPGEEKKVKILRRE